MSSAPSEYAQGAGPVVVIGAGPAGLTAALELVERGRTVTVLEADSVVGGISRTVVADGWRFDIGGHRFFTKVPSVKERWHKILDDDDFLTRSRLSRIFYNRKFFDYPLKAANALRNLGIVEAVRAVSSYLWARIRPPKDQSTFEGFVSARFGRRLYSIFFESYTQKVWGIHPSVMPADWAAQRIKNLSLGRAVLDALLPRRGGRTDVTSLIEEFLYPRLGPGMMWDRAAEQVTDRGGTIVMHATAEVIRHDAGKVTEIVVRTAEGEMTMPASGGVISSMPLGHLVNALEPAPPADVLEAASTLTHRDFLTVAITVPEDAAFPDNWIYIHEPAVEVGRVQNFGAWSPDMVEPGTTCLGLEYFVQEGDRLWTKADADLIEMARRELEYLGLADTEQMGGGWVVRMPKAYPVYDADYGAAIERIGNWLAEEVPMVQPVGRNGMHRYNNQDHSMLTAMLAVENLHGADNDLWAVNVDDDYHEEIAE
ncbi:MAG: NAD(P)/FAD-dependent oxidoreductase [Acidimicrobiales bacterium]